MGEILKRDFMQRFLASKRVWLGLVSVALLAVACSHRPPPGFAPDPSVVGEIQAIRIIPAEAWACPGTILSATYEAILADGSHVPFARSYDSKQPPRLLVVVPFSRLSDAGVSEAAIGVSLRHKPASMTRRYTKRLVKGETARRLGQAVFPSRDSSRDEKPASDGSAA
jgi:hypothetical protein